MLKNTKTYLLIGFLSLAITLIYSTAPSQGEQNSTTYELRPEVNLPQYKTDIRYIVDSYERMMNRFFESRTRNITGMRNSIDRISSQLETVNHKLGNLSVRLARIEKAIDIEMPNSPNPKTSPLSPTTP